MTANNTLVTRYEYNRASLTNSGVGLLVLPSEGVNSTTTTQTFQAGNTQVIGSKVVSETRFQFARTAVDQTPVDRSPTIIVQGSFSGGGAPAQVLADAQNNFEFSAVSFDHRGQALHSDRRTSSALRGEQRLDREL